MTETQEIKIRPFDLEVGMYVCKLDKEWIETSYPLQGFLIENDNQIQTLINECEYVYIDIAKKKFSPYSTTHFNTPSYIKHAIAVQKTQSATPKKTKPKIARPVTTTPKKTLSLRLKSLFKFLDKEHDEANRKHTYHLQDIVAHKIQPTAIIPPQKLVSISQEINFAKHAHTQASNLLKHFMSNIKEGETINLLIAEKAIHDCMISTLRSPDALLLASYLYKKHLAIWEHSMRVCVLAINLGRCLNLSDDELMILGLCGMFHDIGALLISKKMLEEADNQIELMQSHTILGRNILLSCSGKFSEIAAEVAYSHHEYLNGTGFPRRLQNGQISAYTRIITIIDLYVTLTTPNEKSKSLTHYEAMLALLKNTNTLLDEVLVNSFNQCIGTYPVGCFVEMNTGEIGIVLEENIKQKLKPKIMLLTTDDKKPRLNYLIDLAALKEEECLYTIKSIIHPDKYSELNLHIEALVEK